MKAGTRVTLTGVVVPGIASDKYLRVEVDGSDYRIAVANWAVKSAPTDWSAVAVGTPVNVWLLNRTADPRRAFFLRYFKYSDTDDAPFYVMFDNGPDSAPSVGWMIHCEVIE